MKKLSYLILSLFIFVPFVVKAETYTYDLCKTGCEYHDFSDIVNLDINPDEDELVFNLKNEETYNIYSGIETQGITINGNDSTIIHDDTYFFSNNINFNNIRFKSKDDNKKSLVDLAAFHSFNSQEDMITHYVKKKYLLDITNIKNSVFENNNLYITVNKTNIDNTALNGTFLATAITDLEIQNSTINTAIFSGIGGTGPSFLSNVYIKENNTISKKIKRRKITSNISYSEFDNIVNNINGVELYEVEVADNYKEFFKDYLDEIDLSNNIFVYQGIKKAIKENTNLNRFESEFINTYEDSIGYDDIKDLPIEWKSEDENIAKLANGVIIPVGAGSVDLVGKRGNDIYTIHLIVEKVSISEKIDKMTIKVPITGSKIKVWVLVVSALLLGIIGACGYILVKRKK